VRLKISLAERSSVDCLTANGHDHTAIELSAFVQSRDQLIDLAGSVGG
jgi:hypothetical protein